MTLIQLRGGIKQISTNHPHIKPFLQVTALYVCTCWERGCAGALWRSILRSHFKIEMMGNTTCPANQQAFYFSTPENTDILLLRTHSYDYYPRYPCPVSLLFTIVSINHLRATGLDPSVSTSLRRRTAHRILNDIESFTAERFAISGAISNEWLVTAQIHQSAVVLYYIASLQDLDVDA